MSGPPRSTGLSLPVSSAEAARQGRAAAAAGASQARPLGPTKSASHTGTAAPPGRLAKKKKAGRGRMMMVKVFYSLSSPRTDAPQSISTPPLSVNTPTEATSAFLAVLDPALAPPPAPPPQPAPTPSQQQQQQQPNTYSCIARLSAPVWVQLMGQTADRDEGADASGKRARQTEYGMLTLKTCLSAICISRPELVTDPTKDYAVSAVDPYESSLQPSTAGSPHASTSALTSEHGAGGRGGQGLMEGKGMLSWNLAEKREGTTWVCGRVVQTENGRRGGPRSGKRRKLDDDEDDGERETEDDESDEEEGVSETLEVWLQLVERTSFTQTQFLTSLRSFANPAQPQPSSDRASSPPFRRRPPLVQQQSKPVPLGDPVKKKRPRDSNAAPRLSTAGPSSVAPPPAALPPPSVLASLQEPQVLALLAQLLPSLSQPSTSAPTASTAAPFSLDTPQGRALLPAIRTLAKFYGVTLPDPESELESRPPPSAADKGKGRAVNPVASLAAPAASVSSTAAPSPVAMVPAPKRPGPKRKGTAKLKGRDEAFVALSAVAKGNLNPLNADAGCSNCTRRKSTVWREGEGDDGLTVTVCNACGTFFNKHGHHRTTGDRTSPVKVQPAPLAKPSTSRTGSTSSTGRPLQGRLTATCEADLKKVKKRRTKGHGFVAPPSPSKHVGPSHRLLSPGAIFRHGSGAPGSHRAPGQGQFLTSPGSRSPRFRATARNAAATSPLRRNGGGAGAGLRSGYQSDGEERGAMDFSSLFGVHHSPSPSRKHVMPEYLLTASPGTALARILNETSVDLDGFDATMRDAGPPPSHADDDDDDPDLSLYVRSSPTDEKENAVPNELLTTDDGAGTSGEYDSLVSSLRRDFSNRMSSTALTAPSSPPASSPCVQPRTSSATPGQKSKQPQSCGRPAPSILDSFIDSLVPAFTLNHVDGDTPASDSDAWTPASMGDHDLDRTMMQLDPMSDGGHQQYGTTHRHPPIPYHLTARLGAGAAATSDDYDFGSLPPSSPPLLPSEAIPTPSEHDSGVTPDSGITPDGEGYDDARYDAPPPSRQDAVAALVQSLGGGGFGAAAALDGSDRVSLDRSTVAQLLQMISAGGGGTHLPAQAPVDAYAPSPFDVFGGKDLVPTPVPVGHDGDDEQSELNDLYQSLFSDSRGYEPS